MCAPMCYHWLLQHLWSTDIQQHLVVESRNYNYASYDCCTKHHSSTNGKHTLVLVHISECMLNSFFLMLVRLGKLL